MNASQTERPDPPATEVAVRMEVARDLAIAGGQLALGYFRREDLEVHSKADTSPVTVADRSTEQFLREQIGLKFPSDGILGEEYDERPGESGFRWIVDPIDGTKTFIRGVPLWGTMVAVEFAGRAVIGAMSFPALDEHIYAATGQKCWYQQGGSAPRLATVSAVDRWEDCLFCVTDAASFARQGRGDVYAAIEGSAWISRSWGDCYGYLLVATGRAEVMIDAIMNVWDAAALQPIIEEAGGTFTDFQGNRTIDAGEGIATNGRLLEKVLDVTRGT
ncbi:MAG: histidinol-phosphatase [Pirellulales bacterium]